MRKRVGHSPVTTTDSNGFQTHAQAAESKHSVTQTRVPAVSLMNRQRGTVPRRARQRR